MCDACLPPGALTSRIALGSSFQLGNISFGQANPSSLQLCHVVITEEFTVQNTHLNLYVLEQLFMPFFLPSGMTHSQGQKAQASSSNITIDKVLASNKLLQTEPRLLPADQKGV